MYDNNRSVAESSVYTPVETGSSRLVDIVAGDTTTESLHLGQIIAEEIQWNQLDPHGPGVAYFDIAYGHI